MVPYSIVLLALGACQAGPQPPATVRVAAASDLKFALDEAAPILAAAGVTIEPTYGSSGNFHAQLLQRAPFDVYLSADVEYPRDLVARGVGREADLFTYAVGGLVVWVPAGSPLPVERDGLGVLLKADRIAMANPRHAPYGRAAEAALRAAGLDEQVRPRLVIGDSVVQAAQFVQSGAADAGLIARSLALAPGMREAGRFVDVAPEAYPALTQGGLVLPWAASSEAASKVRDFLIGPQGQALLARHGFRAPVADVPANRRRTAG